MFGAAFSQEKEIPREKGVKKDLKKVYASKEAKQDILENMFFLDDLKTEDFDRITDELAILS